MTILANRHQGLQKIVRVSLNATIGSRGCASEPNELHARPADRHPLWLVTPVLFFFADQ